MPRNFYYLVSSLPSLKLNDKPPLSSAGFLDLCRPWLDEKEFAAVRDASLDEPFAPSGGGEVAQRWTDFETNLRNELAGARAKSLELEARRFTRPVSDLYPDAAVRANEAMHDDSPLNAEKRLVAARWEFLDGMEGEHYFDLGFLLIFRLKLLLLERLARFDHDRGLQVFESVYRSI